MRLGIDLDGVVYDFVDALRTHVHETHGVSLDSMPDAESWDFFSDQWGMTFDDYKAHCLSGIRDCKIFRSGNTIPGSSEGIHQLKSEGHEIIFLTSRSGFGEEARLCRLSTQHWLHEKSIDYDGLILSEDKVNRGVDLLLEDAPHQIRKSREANEVVIVFDQAWNRLSEFDDLPRAFSWSDFYEMIWELDKTGALIRTS